MIAIERLELQIYMLKAEQILNNLRPDTPYSLDEESGRTLLAMASKQLAGEIGEGVLDVKRWLADGIILACERKAPRSVNQLMREIERSGQPLLDINFDSRKDFPLAYNEEIILDGVLSARRMRVVLRAATPFHLSQYELSIRRQGMKQAVAATLTADGAMKLKRLMDAMGVSNYDGLRDTVHPSNPTISSVLDDDDNDDIEMF